MLEALRELDHGLRSRGSRLVVRIGRPEHELPAVARSVGAGAVFVADDPAGLRTGKGGRYTVFTPFYRAWLRAPRRDVFRAPRSLPEVPRHAGSSELPSLSSFGLDGEPVIPEPMPEGLQHELGCIIGRDYPEPIVDHAEARREALARYAEARAADEPLGS